MSLKISIVGAGIAGLCTAIALRQAGHDVKIFEKSKFATEIGAALAITPNGARVLSSLGFSFTKARACRTQIWHSLLGETLQCVNTIDFSLAEKMFGAELWTVHRVDFHNELLRLATTDEVGGTKPVTIQLGAQVVSASAEGCITLADGTKHQADLIVAADGLHSVVRSTVLGGEPQKPTSSGMSAFRFLLDTSIFENDKDLASLLNVKGPGAVMLPDARETVLDRHMVWYPCRDDAVQNIVGIHPTRKEDLLNEEGEDTKQSMLKEFAHFHPGVVKMINHSSYIKCWPLYYHEPLSTWHRGRIILIGDAAHPMLPFGGQGSNQALEDAGALGAIFRNLPVNTSYTDLDAIISTRLSLFEQVRLKRAARVQVLSKTRVGREYEVEGEMKKHVDGDGAGQVPTNPRERLMHDYGFNVLGKCNDVMQGAGIVLNNTAISNGVNGAH